MGILRKLNYQGDATLTWDADTKEGVDKVIVEMERHFSKGGVAFKVSGSESEKIKVFDPAAEEIILVAQYAGG